MNSCILDLAAKHATRRYLSPCSLTDYTNSPSPSENSKDCTFDTRLSKHYNCGCCCRTSQFAELQKYLHFTAQETHSKNDKRTSHKLEKHISITDKKKDYLT